MKTHTFILTLSLVAVSFGLLAHSEEKKKESSAKTEILDIVDTENLSVDECVACPVPVQVFDKNFRLIMTGEMTPMEEINNQELKIMIGQSNLIMDSGSAIIYQME